MDNRRRFLGNMAAFVGGLALPNIAQAQNIAAQTAVHPNARNRNSLTRLSLDIMIEQARADWGVPGLGVVIASADEVLFSKAFGQRTIGGANLTADSLFGLASTSKAFTAAMMAVLVAEGQLAWDTKVKDVIPGFAFADGTDRGVTLEDCLSHRTGLMRHDMVWYGRDGFDGPQLVSALKGLTPEFEIRSRYYYNNLMVMLAAYMAEKVIGQPWQMVMDQKVLSPLGLSGTNGVALNAAAAQGRQSAIGHKLVDGVATPMAYRPQDGIGAAGALFASPNHFGRWISALLGQGKLRGVQILPAAQMANMFLPRILSDGAASADDGLGFYGLGWRIDRWDGQSRISHGGNLNGHSARITLLPEENIGMAIFANVRAMPLCGLLTMDIFEKILGSPAENHAATALARRRAAAQNRQAPIIVAQEMALPLAIEKYAGRYAHPAYGEVVIGAQNGVLAGQMHNMGFTITHNHDGLFLTEPANPSDDDLSGLSLIFDLDFDGQIGGFRWRFDGDEAAINFARTSVNP